MRAKSHISPTVDALLSRNQAGERDFRGTDLCGLDLRGADLSGCELSGADLRGTRLGPLWCAWG